MGSPALVFVSRKKMAAELCALLLKAGVAADYVTGAMSVRVRKTALDSLNSGLLDVVVCTSVWAKGVDIPALRSIVRASGGSAPIGLKQESGRGTRLFDGKGEFTIWDLAKADDAHQRARIVGYRAAGFRISDEVERALPKLEPSKEREHDAALEELLEPSAPRQRARASPQPDEEPEVPLWKLMLDGGAYWRGAGPWLIFGLLTLCGIVHITCPSY